MDERIAGLATYYETAEAARVLLSDLGIEVGGGSALEILACITDVDAAVAAARLGYPWAPAPVPREAARWRAVLSKAGYRVLVDEPPQAPVRNWAMT
jgi:hypothetical protein